MASDSVNWGIDPVSVVLGVVALAAIAGEVYLSAAGHTIPGALESIIYVAGGGLAGALGTHRKAPDHPPQRTP